MKSLPSTAGLRKRKYSTQDIPAKYWGTLGKKGKEFERTDGTTSVDKTRGFHSRPTRKQTARNANRAANKAARAVLKQQLKNVVS